MSVNLENVNFETNYLEIYPHREDIFLQSLEKLSEGIGVQLGLYPTTKGFSHFLYSINDTPFQKSRKRDIVVRFEDKHVAEVQKITVTVKAISKADISSKPYTVTMNYYPKEMFAASGRTSPGVIQVFRTDLLLFTSHVEDWIRWHPTPGEKEYARKKWGHLMIDGRSNYENACALAKSIIDDLEPHKLGPNKKGGLPSDKMDKLSIFEQYKRSIAGKDGFHCANAAAFFSYACSALGIISRDPGMGRLWPANQKGEYLVMLAAGHVVTEIFSEQLNQWIFMDVWKRILGVYLGKEGPLNLAEVHLFSNNDNRVKKLRVVQYDPKTKKEKNIAVMTGDKWNVEFTSFKRDQRFDYARRDRDKRL